MLKKSFTDLLRNIEKSAMEKLNLKIENKKMNEAIKSYEKRINELISKQEEILQIKKENNALKEIVIELKSKIESITLLYSTKKNEVSKFDEYSENTNNDIDFNF